ncbi:unnamed protein product [Caenorhabditis sp. 36 PRJEB53466]|nr:unnamed protein product [Caenorhabditis sp. 36 PRJEB53466]
MIKIVLFLSVLFIPNLDALLGPTTLESGWDEQCTKDMLEMHGCMFDKTHMYAERYDERNEGNKVLLEPFFKAMANASATCFKSSNCTMYLMHTYYFDISVFIGQKTYGNAFECLNNTDMEKVWNNCTRTLIARYQPDFSFRAYKKHISYCVAREQLKCSLQDKRDFLALTHAQVDRDHLFADLEKYGNKAFVFNPEKYEYLLDDE